MKKIILGIAVSVAFAVAAAAQVHQSESFLGVQALYSTNGLTATNLNFPGLTTTTNFVGISFTNMGTRVTTSATVADKYNFLRTVPLKTDRNASPVGIGGYFYTNEVVGAYQPVYGNISGAFTAQSGANSAVTFTFVPVPETAAGLPNDASALTAAGEEWSFSITATASATTTFKTNAPMWRWPGCAGLMCKRIVNGDTDATSAVIITSLKYNTFIP